MPTTNRRQPPESRRFSLTTNIALVPGVGDRRAEAFRRLGIRCVADLLLHLPMRYEHELQEQPIGKASGETISPNHGTTANISVQGEIQTTQSKLGRRPRVEATLFDGTGTMMLTWFNAPWMRSKLHPGMHIRAWGKVKRHGDYLQLINAQWEEIKPEKDTGPRAERHRPVYSSNEDLSSLIIEKAINAVLDDVLAKLDDHLHDDYRRQAALPTLAEAYRMVHRPADADEIAAGRRRLAFDELLMLQLGVMLKRRHRHDTLTAPPLKHTAAIDKHIKARFPFTLTEGQQVVIADMVKDLKRPTPMNRLVQGDVGSGKTVVALYAMLMAVASKQQAALMAPTELLAEQHFASITQMLTGSRVKIELLTGSLKPAQRRDVHARLEAGEIDMLIGTHALLTEKVTFKQLAVAVVDEQHRFGVHQRATLRAKAGDEHSSPHVLVMTATPIPRTMSLTVFGDLDISTIRTLPPGRQPIVTKLVGQRKSDEVYRWVAERLEQGEQAYIVVPMIEEGASGLKDVLSHHEWLSKGPLHGKGLAVLHGRIKREQREGIMQQFRDGAIDALVATTVIEVGVDVPNASIMVIEHADRFGLAQLHQLRGRIGRGSRKSVCVLIADPVTEDGQARVDAIAATTDGFVIAEKDLEIRGPGELFGSRQSGLAPFRVAEIPRDIDLLQMARRDAAAWIDENPTLDGQRDALLRRRLLKAHGKALGLGDVA